MRDPSSLQGDESASGAEGAAPEGTAAAEDPGGTSSEADVPEQEEETLSGSLLPGVLATEGPALFEDGDLVANRYRIVRFIARGGMGEVYEAEDAELGLSVALKAVRPEVAVHSQTLDRFRREISLARKVTDPNVCRIYDAGTHDDGLRGVDIRFLTMELLQGETLSSMLRRRGSLPEDEAVPLVRQIASGLEAAHAAGVVHRDFKCSNVILVKSPGGTRAVVTDFGLSQPFDADGGTGAERLTGTGQLMGTLAYLAPEQLEGKPCSPATDLYSLGVVFYQMVTGALPFEARTPLMTALKRLNEAPTDPRLHKPDLDPVCEAVLLRCLRRDPKERFTSASELRAALRPDEGTVDVALTPKADRRPLWIAAALLVALAVFVAGWLASGGGEPEPRRVAVRVQVEGMEPGDEAFFRSGLEAAAVRGLIAFEGLAVVDPSRLEGRDLPADRLVLQSAADEIVTLDAARGDGEWRVTLRRVDDGGVILWAEELRAPVDDEKLLASAVATHLRRGYPDRPPRPGFGVEEISHADYREFLRLRHTLDSPPDGVDWLDVLARIEGLRSRSPRFPETYLLEARLSRYLFNQTRDAEDLEHAFEMTRQARELAPSDPRPLQTEIDIALKTERFDEARRALEALRQRTPGDLSVLVSEARLMQAQGNLETAADTMQRVVALRPAREHRFLLADMELGRGRVEEARELLEPLVEDFEGDYFARQKLARLELYWGDPKRAEMLFAELMERNPELVTLNNLGVARLFLGDYGGAAAAFEQILDRAAGHPVPLLNHADALALGGDPEGAGEAYGRVLDLVGREGGSFGHEYWALSAQALAHLGRHDDAVVAIEKALLLRAEDPQVRYLASLVHALVGNAELARLHGEQAKSLGLAPRWFSLPWFETAGLGDLAERG
ncbi:MAG: protein kinase [Acidobacteriota bacterium]